MAAPISLYFASIIFLLFIIMLQILSYIILKIFYSHLSELRVNRIFASFTLISISFAILIHIFVLISQPISNFCFLYETIIGLFVITTNSEYLSLIILFFAFFSFGSIYQSFLIQRLYFIEFYIIFLICIVTGMILTFSNNLFLIYTLLELLTLSYFILASLKRTSTFSSESGVKYFVIGSIISCIFLCSIFVLFSIYSTANLHTIDTFLVKHLDRTFFYSSQGQFTIYAIFIFLFCIACKLGMPVVHFWTLDVYEGSPLGATIVFSYVTKIILIDLVAKFLLIFKGFIEPGHLDTIMCMCGGSIGLGLCFVLGQTRAKRFLVYTSIAQIGFPIMAFIIGCRDLPNIVWYYKVGYLYIIVYTLITIILWSLYTNFHYHFIVKNSKEGSNFYLTDFAKIKPTDDYLFLIISAIFILASGIPPFAGFYIKWYLGKGLLFVNLGESDLGVISTIIFIFLMIISVISMYYYLRVLKWLSNSFVYFKDKYTIPKINKAFFVNLYVDNDFLNYYQIFTFLFLLNLLYSCIIFDTFWIDMMDIVVSRYYISYPH